VAVRDWGEKPEALAEAFSGDRHAPPALTEAELARLVATEPLAGAPDHVRADTPQWLVPALREAWDDDWIEEARAMTGRPPLDLRANTLKATREKVLRALGRFNPEPGPVAPQGLRLAAGSRDSRTPNVQTDEGYIKGWFEV